VYLCGVCVSVFVWCVCVSIFVCVCMRINAQSKECMIFFADALWLRIKLNESCLCWSEHTVRTYMHLA